jgi:glutaredoxin
MTSLLRRIFGRKPTAEHLTFTVYTRAECGCCHKAMDVLEEYRERYGFRIETVDVDGDPELAAKYGMEVPVVAVGGKVRFRGKVNPALLERLLVAEAAGRTAE